MVFGPTVKSAARAGSFDCTFDGHSIAQQVGRGGNSPSYSGGHFFAELKFRASLSALDHGMSCNNRPTNEPKTEARALPAQPGFRIILAFRGG